MTSELLIMNSSAVALAADSVVTVDNRKTYTGVNKLFMLSNNPPMGIMTYNLATFLGIPLETIIKEFRKEISEKDIHSICEFKDEFEKFLNGVVSKSNNQKSFTDYMNLFINIARNDYERLSVNEFKNIIHESANNWDNANLNHFNDEILGLLNENIEYFKDYLIEINMYSDDFLNIFKKCFMNYLFFNNNELLVLSLQVLNMKKCFHHLLILRLITCMMISLF